MNKKFRIFILAIIAVVAVSCGDNDGQDHSEEGHNHSEAEHSEANHEEADDDHHAPISGLVKDGDNKWEANAETTDGVNNMIQIMKAFDSKDDLDAYYTLNDDLQGEFNMIFENCTMKGEAHNQLHNFLHPMMAIFEELESTDLTSCKKSFAKMDVHLHEYSKYFE